MAKKAEVQKELDLEGKKKAEDSNAKEEVLLVGEEDKDQKDVKAEDDVEKRIKDLQDKMAKSDAERKSALERADRLEKERAEATEKATKAEGRAAITQKEAILQALDASQKSLEMHRKELKAALESGDSDKVVEHQEKLSEAAYLSAELKKNKISFDLWEKQQEEISKQPKNTGPTPETKAWMDRNPRFNTDQEFKAEAESAHYAAIQRGIRPDSIAYFEFIDHRIEKVLGYNDKNDKEEAPLPKKEERQPSYSAPPSRGDGGGDGSGGGKKQYKLTAAQREAASICGMTDLEYAQSLESEKGRQ